MNGTFTHPSPIAGLVYTGAAANRPITLLVEQRDGLTLFGRPLEALTPAEFDRLAGRLRISAVVALDEDDGRLPFLDDNPGFARPSRVGPFVIYASREPRPIPMLVAPQRWQFRAADPAGGWAATGFAYSPLWRARAGDQRLAARRDDLGMLEVKLPAGPLDGRRAVACVPGPRSGSGSVSPFSAACCSSRARQAESHRAGRS